MTVKMCKSNGAIKLKANR